MKFNPRSYQQLGIDFLLRTPRCGLFAQPGLGKTVMALTTIDWLHALDSDEKTIAVMPKRVLDTEGWQRELEKWDHLRGLAIETITGSAQKRREKLRSPAPIHIIHYEMVPWLLDELVRCWPYTNIILDESTKIQSHDGTWFKGNPRSLDYVALGSKLTLPDGRVLCLDHDTPKKLPGNTRVLAPPKGSPDAGSRRMEFTPTPGLVHVARQSDRLIEMTGTPMPNGIKGLWSQLYLMDEGKRLGKNISSFREQFMQPHPYVKHQWVEQQGALDRVVSQIGDICMSIKAADYLDLPELITNTIDIRLGDDLMADYRFLEKEFFLALEEHIVEAANSAVLGNKLRQFTQGVMYTDKKGAWQEIHRLKIDALKELSDEVNAPMLVCYHFDPDRERLLKHIKGSVVFNGTRKQIEAFARGHVQHLLVHPASAGHGVEGLQDGSDTIAFFGSDWSLETYDQVIERIGPTRQLQSGHPRPVFVNHLCVQNTVEELVLQRLIQRKTTQEILMNAVKRYKEQTHE